jgi:hypothetical protein
MSSIRKLFRRRFTGELSEIVTPDGEVHRATVNHPFLTTRGWVAAKDVKVGDYLVEVSKQGAFTTEADAHNTIGFEDLFSALSLVLDTEMTSGSFVQFHGDGTDEDVDIINVDSFLRDALEPGSFENLNKDLLAFAQVCNTTLAGGRFSALLGVTTDDTTRSGISTLCEFLPILKTGVLHALKHRRATSTGINAVTLEQIGNSLPSGSDVFRKCLDAFPGEIPPDDVIAVELLRVMCGAILSRDSIALSAESLSETTTGATESDGDVLKEFAGLKHTTSRVEKVGSEFFSGHVYNLESVNNWYTIAQDLVVHNCRCTARGVINLD